MKKGLAKPLLVMLLGASILGYSAIALKPKPERMPVYSQETKSFIQRKGGINEKALSSGLYELCKKYATEKKLIKRFEEAEAMERKFEFISLDEYRHKKDQASIEKDPLKWSPSTAYGISELMTEINLLQNRTILQDLRLKKEIGKKHKKLKKLISKLNPLCEKAQNNLEKLIVICNYLSKYSDHHYRYADKSADILEFLESGGDCNEVAPAYSAILNNYGIKSDLPMGVVTSKETGEEVGHVWLRVDIDGQIFDLDPTWYKGFVPLEIRTSNLS